MATLDAPNPADLSTSQLVEQVCGGRVECFAEIVRRYQQDVFRVVNAMLFDHGSVEELVQRVFVKVYASLNTFRLGRDFGPWIRTVARNAVREELRTTARYARRLEAYRQTVETEWDHGSGVDERQQRLHEALEACLGKLPGRARSVVEMRYRQGRRFEQVAAELETTAGALRNLLCRVREQLRLCIQQEMAER